MSNILWILIISAIIRIGPIIYLSTFESITKYPVQLTLTDIDYKVYTDAALLYDSPYERHTYRYTPLLAYTMKFNDQYEYAGKIFLVLGDLAAICFLWAIFKGKNFQSAITKIYAYNPIFIYLTVRGSC